MESKVYDRTQQLNLAGSIKMRGVGMGMAAMLLISMPVINLFAQCPTAPGSATVTGNLSFGSTHNWANPNRSVDSDDLYARVTLSAGDTSKYLASENYGFVVPLTATIMGIEVRVEKHMDPLAEVYDASVRLQQGWGPVGTEHADPTEWALTDKITVYGGPTDLWGLTLTPTDVMDPNFGFFISATRIGGPATLDAYVDDIQMIIYYDDPGGCLLPVELTAFEGREQNGQVALQWVTASESNSALFTLFRSGDGNQFEEIGQVNANGIPSTYQFTDVAPQAGMNFYRLQQTDKNGYTQQFQTIQVYVDPATMEVVSTWPNPSSGGLNIRVQSDDPAAVSLYSLQGALLRTGVTEGGTLFWDLSTMAKGVYLIRVESQGKMLGTHKVVLN